MPDLTPTEDDLARDLVADLEEFERLAPDSRDAAWRVCRAQSARGDHAGRVLPAAIRRYMAERGRADRLQALLTGVSAGDVSAYAVGYVVEVRHAAGRLLCQAGVATLDEAERLAACINELLAAVALTQPVGEILT